MKVSVNSKSLNYFKYSLFDALVEKETVEQIFSAKNNTVAVSESSFYWKIYSVRASSHFFKGIFGVYLPLTLEGQHRNEFRFFYQLKTDVFITNVRKK